MAAIVRLDKIQNGHLESFKYATDLANGTVVSLASAENADGTKTGAVVTLGKTTVLHASVPMGYDETLREQDIVLKAGEVGRGYILTVGDRITITNDGVSGTPLATSILAVEATKNVFKIYADLTTAPASGYALEVVSLTETLEGKPATKYQVVRV